MLRDLIASRLALLLILDRKVNHEVPRGFFWGLRPPYCKKHLRIKVNYTYSVREFIVSTEPSWEFIEVLNI